VYPSPPLNFVAGVKLSHSKAKAGHD